VCWIISFGFYIALLVRVFIWFCSADFYGSVETYFSMCGSSLVKILIRSLMCSFILFGFYFSGVIVSMFLFVLGVWLFVSCPLKFC